MGEGAEHPITTPKGQTVFTVILTVIGVFAPFLGGLGFAQLFSVLAIAVILWLYHSEIGDVHKTHRGLARLWPPGVAISIILIVVVGATWAIAQRPSAASANPLTADDIARAVRVAMQEEDAYKIADPVRPTTRFVFQEPIALPPPSRLPDVEKPPKSEPSSSATAASDYLRKRIAGMTAGQDEYLQCIRGKGAISGSLYGLISKAAEMQNAYYYGRNDKKMVSDLKTWMDEVRVFFAEHKDDLPDIKVIELANSSAKANTFLGIHNSGEQAWGDMDAKKEALQIIGDAAGKQSCEAVRAAAFAECVRAGKCAN